MGKANVRLNPRVSQSVRRQIVKLAACFLMPLLKEKFKEGNKPVSRGAPQKHADWVKALCLFLKVICALSWEGYEALIRSHNGIMEIIGVKSLPSKTIVFLFEKQLPQRWFKQFVWDLVKKYCRQDMWVACDSTGIGLVKRSAWYCLRVGKELLRRENLKLHILQDITYGLIVNASVTAFNTHDSPILRKLLQHFNRIGAVFGDAAYTCRATIKLVAKKKGFCMMPFKSNSTAKARGCMAWSTLYWFWKNANWLFRSIYHQRSKVESAFSSIKRSFGATIRTKQKRLYAKEVMLMVAAYNIRQILYIEFAKKQDLQLWTRA